MGRRLRDLMRLGDGIIIGARMTIGTWNNTKNSQTIAIVILDRM